MKTQIQKTHRRWLGLLALVLAAWFGPAIASAVVPVQFIPGYSYFEYVRARHFIGQSGPTAIGTPVAGTGCGTSSAPVVTGDDASGTVGVTCGTTGVWQGTILTETFVKPYQNNAVCQIGPANRATAQLAVVNVPFETATTTTFSLVAGSAALPAGTFLWSYDCTDRI